MLIARALTLALAGLGAGPVEGPSESPSEAPTIEPGLAFGEGVTKRERLPLRERFDAALGDACEPPPCTGDCQDDEARLGVIVDGVERDYSLRWRVDDPRLDAPLKLESSCELCSLVDLEDQLAADIGSLCTRLGTLEQAPGRVRVTSDPSGAAVRVDGRRVGKTPWTGELPAGEHTLELHAPGYASEARTLTTLDGIEEREHIELMARARPRPYWPAWMTLSLGVALGIAGTALIAIDGKEWTGRCAGEDLDVLGNCRYVYATGELGIGLAAAGAASFGTGVGLMIWAQTSRHGGGLAVRGSF